MDAPFAGIDTPLRGTIARLQYFLKHFSLRIDDNACKNTAIRSGLEYKINTFNMINTYNAIKIIFLIAVDHFG